MDIFSSAFGNGMQIHIFHHLSIDLCNSSNIYMFYLFLSSQNKYEQSPFLLAIHRLISWQGSSISSIAWWLATLSVSSIDAAHPF